MKREAQNAAGTPAHSPMMQRSVPLERQLGSSTTLGALVEWWRLML